MARILPIRVHSSVVEHLTADQEVVIGLNPVGPFEYEYIFLVLKKNVYLYNFTFKE